MRDVAIEQTCPMCGEQHYIVVDLDKYTYWENRWGLIQDIFPEYSPMEREFIKSGYCPKCQEQLFGSDTKTERIKKVSQGFLDLKKAVEDAYELEDDEWEEAEHDLVIDYIYEQKGKLNPLDVCYISSLGYEPDQIISNMLE